MHSKGLRLIINPHNLRINFNYLLHIGLHSTQYLHLERSSSEALNYDYRPFKKYPPPPPRQTISIYRSGYVARALNYIHLIQQHPLIHRDISSANVLLEPLLKNCWKAKVSYYGIVNLLDTICLGGNPSYAAPEANDPNQQSNKMDTFSFGEMLTARGVSR